MFSDPQARFCSSSGIAARCVQKVTVPEVTATPSASPKMARSARSGCARAQLDHVPVRILQKNLHRAVRAALGPGELDALGAQVALGLLDRLDQHREVPLARRRGVLGRATD